MDANQDSDFLDAGEQLFDDEGAIDDNWSAGYVGLANWLETAQEFDDLRVGIDNNSDGDIADAGDDVQIDDDFSSTTMSLTYDDNGNLTDDGVFKFVYDAWNRLVEVTRRVDDETTVAEYEYDGKNRRTMKTVTNCGVEDTPNDGGNTTVEYYYGGVAANVSSAVDVAAGLRAGRWNVFETRNGSSQTTFQYVWGTQYVDELVMIDKNGDPTESNDCDPDDQSGESTADERYFVHQDRNWNVVALTDYDPSGSDEGNVVERYHYTPYGQFIVLNGNSGNGEWGNVLPTSTVGNPFAHQGLYHDHETGTDQQRWRQRQADRFMQRDPWAYADGPNVYSHQRALPVTGSDPSGGSMIVDDILKGILPGLAAMATCCRLDVERAWGDDYGDDTVAWGYKHCVAHCAMMKSPFCGGRAGSEAMGIATELYQIMLCLASGKTDVGECRSAWQASDWWDNELGRECAGSEQSCADCCEERMGGKSTGDLPEGPNRSRPYGPFEPNEPGPWSPPGGTDKPEDWGPEGQPPPPDWPGRPRTAPDPSPYPFPNLGEQRCQ